MVQPYKKEHVLETDKPDYDGLYAYAFSQLADMSAAYYTKSDTDMVPTEYVYKKASKVDLLGEQPQHQETKIENMERRIMYLEEQLMISNHHIIKLTKHVQKLLKPDQMHFESLRQQNEAARKDLRSIFGIEPDDTIDTKELDGLLSDFVDPEEDSRDLIRSIRGR